MKVVICIPAFNEERVIAEAAQSVHKALGAIVGIEYEIVVADNGSTDSTAAHTRQIRGVRVVEVPERGKGAAVVTALGASQGDFFGFIDADLSASPDQIANLLEPLQGGECDIAIGSRLLSTHGVKREWMRTFLSKVFNTTRKLALGISVKDTQCGLKLMNERGREVLSLTRETGWFFDMEFLARAETAGLRIKEIPIHWDEHRFPGRKSKLKLVRDGFGTFAALLRIYRSMSLRVVNGSILSKFSHLELSTADEKVYSVDMTPVTRLALKIIGVPHLGFRLRARMILHEAKKTNILGRILDAGCGYGIYAMSLAELGYKVDAIDVDPRRIESLRDMLTEYPILNANISLSTGSLTSLPFPSHTYDTIVCSEVIEHIKDDERAVSELSRVIKPAGTVILSVPYDSAYNKKVYKRFDHERPGYNRSSIEKILTKHGLTIEKVFYYERSVGRVLFDAFNALRAKPLMGLFFYPFYILYLIDYFLGFGEPSQMVVVAKKA